MFTAQTNACQAHEAAACFVEPLPRHLLRQLHERYPYALDDMEWATVYYEVASEYHLTPFAYMYHNFEGVWDSWEEFVEVRTFDFLAECRKLVEAINDRQKVQQLIDYFSYRRFADDLEEDYWFVELTDDSVVIFRRC